ncbi:hypothetical protein [Tateyamaria sp. Alg231-49]|uniref:hypothetical protein n=1 Tax=Tateyamaria sp. Alg231-49 TaxID=1922219 RepID=UPI000D55B266|nr:hypothetical protein [Tateyamaria sp. Alg231-49]
MNLTRKTILPFTALCLFTSACVNPEVVTVKSISDDALTCSEIKTQLGQLQQIQKEAEKGRTASGENVAAAILFWPAVIGNNMNAKQAQEAATARQTVLVDLYKQKRCK